jgi:hypothetical protein
MVFTIFYLFSCSVLRLIQKTSSEKSKNTCKNISSFVFFVTCVFKLSSHDVFLWNETYSTNYRKYCQNRSCDWRPHIIHLIEEKQEFGKVKFYAKRNEGYSKIFIFWNLISINTSYLSFDRVYTFIRLYKSNISSS